MLSPCFLFSLFVLCLFSTCRVCAVVSSFSHVFLCALFLALFVCLMALFGQVEPTPAESVVVNGVNGNAEEGVESPEEEEQSEEKPAEVEAKEDGEVCTHVCCPVGLLNTL